MPVQKQTTSDIAGLVSTVVQIANKLPEGRFLWFRGVSHATYDLLPKLMRDGKPGEAVFEREKRLITRFRQRSLAYWPAGYPQSDWEHLFAMQHYGMPTRLLDWSENLLVAAYFAMGTAIDDNSCHPAVWCLDPVAWNQATPSLSEYGETVQVLTTSSEDAEAYRPDTTRPRKKSPVALFGAHNSQRIVAQRGTFMIWGNEPEPLQNIATASKCNLWEIQITGGRKKLAHELSALGFGETMVFPELPSLAGELARSEGWRS